MNKGWAFFYVNADATIGSGHFWRCYTIAHELKKFNIQIGFLYSALNEKLIKLLEQGGFSFIHIKDAYPETFIKTIQLQNEHPSSLLITDTDNTHFYEKIFQEKIIEAGILLMTITVNASFHYYSHLLLNQNIIALSQRYSVEGHTKKLFGPQYFIYTPQFRKLGMQPVKPIGDEIFIAFGSADPCHFTFQLLKEIIADDYFRRFNFHVVVGAFNSNYTEIEQLSHQHSNINLYYNSTEMAAIMLKCNLALCAPGLIFWELTLMGIHSILFSGSAREKFLGNFLHEKKYAYMFQHYDENFDNEKFGSFKKLIAGMNPGMFTNFQKLRNTINPDGVYKIASEINKLLN